MSSFVFRSEQAGSTIEVDLKRVGNFPVNNRSPFGVKYPCPMFITAGDISRDGKIIILRTFDGKYNRSNIDNIVSTIILFVLVLIICISLVNYRSKDMVQKRR